MILPLVIFSSCTEKESGRRLFILTGQSNIEGLDPEESFIPAVKAEFGAENINVIKDAIGGQPIRRWFKDYNPETETQGRNHPMIGRLSDFDMNNEKYPHWTMMRDIQVKVAESNRKFD